MRAVAVVLASGLVAAPIGAGPAPRAGAVPAARAGAVPAARAGAVPAASPAALGPPAAGADDASWVTIGNGVAFKDTGDAQGANVFVAYAGYHVQDASARAWASALHAAALRARGVRYLWAVRGPDDPLYRHAEIASSALARSLAATVNRDTTLIVVAGHSSGSYVAHELFGRLDDRTAAKIVYFDLDGGDNGLGAAAVKRLRGAYFVGAFDALTRTQSPHADKMRAMASAFGATYLEHDASASGCNAGAAWCVHASLVNARPHDPSTVDAVRDYSDFAGRAVAHRFIDDAGL